MEAVSWPALNPLASTLGEGRGGVGDTPHPSLGKEGYRGSSGHPPRTRATCDGLSVGPRCQADKHDITAPSRPILPVQRQCYVFVIRISTFEAPMRDHRDILFRFA